MGTEPNGNHKETEAQAGTFQTADDSAKKEGPTMTKNQIAKLLLMMVKNIWSVAKVFYPEADQITMFSINGSADLSVSVGVEEDRKSFMTAHMFTDGTYMVDHEYVKEDEK